MLQQTAVADDECQLVARQCSEQPYLCADAERATIFAELTAAVHVAHSDDFLAEPNKKYINEENIYRDMQYGNTQSISYILLHHARSVRCKTMAGNKLSSSRLMNLYIIMYFAQNSPGYIFFMFIYCNL